MRFLLAVPRLISKKGRYYDFPLGIAYVSATLKRAGHEVHCLNLNHTEEAPADAVARKVSEVDPDVFATGGLSPHFPRAKDILDAARGAKPSIINMLGGGLISADPEGVGPLLDVDVGVVGEGEETVEDLARVLEAGGDLAGVAGITYPGEDGKWIVTPPRTAIRSLDDLPWPDFEGFEVEKLLDGQISIDNGLLHLREDPRCLPMISSRRCPFACTFCYHPMGRGYRERGLDDFFAELDHLVERYGINQLTILDELFSLKKDRLAEFCDRIRPYDLQWSAQFHVSVIDEDTVGMMHDAGCVYASYGLESMSDTVLDSMKKKTKRTDVERALKVTYDQKIGIFGNFIFGDPAETLATANETMAWWARNRKYHVSLSRIQVYPGSELYERALAKGTGPSREEMIRGTCSVNFLDLDEEGYRYFIRRMEIFRETLKEPAEVLSCEKEDEPHPSRGDLYDIHWRCPRCGGENHYAHVPVDGAGIYQSFHMTCRSCRSVYDIPNPGREAWVVPELEERYAQARALRDAGKLNEAVALYRNLASEEFSVFSHNRPDAIIQACHDLGEIFLQSGQYPRSATWFLGEALFRRAFDPAAHATYGIALLAEGCPGAARLHLEQARRLLAADDSGLRATLDTLEGPLQEAERTIGADVFFS